MKYQCNMIHDLMLPCAEGTASAEGRAAVRTHLTECRDCAKEWKALTGSKKISEKTAKFRLSKKAKKGIVTVLLAAIAVYFAAALMIPYAGMFAESAGTPEAAMEKAVQKHSYITGPYDADRILGVKDFGDDYIFCWMLNDIGCGTYYISPFCGKYRCGGCTSRGIPDDQQICTVTDDCLFIDEGSPAVLHAYYAKDPAVRTIRVTIGEHTETAECNENGLCVMAFPDENSVQNTDPKAPEITGEARDADGNVLYTLEEPDWVHNINRYRWVGVPDSQ